MKNPLITSLAVGLVGLAGCVTDAPDLATHDLRGPEIYQGGSVGMPKAWVDSAMGQSVFTPAPLGPPVRNEMPPVSRVVQPREPVINYPYGTPVPGRPGLVQSPYSTKGYVDIQGMPPETLAKCPYTGKVFLVP